MRLDEFSLLILLDQETPDVNLVTTLLIMGPFSTVFTC